MDLMIVCHANEILTVHKHGTRECLELLNLRPSQQGLIQRMQYDTGNSISLPVLSLFCSAYKVDVGDVYEYIPESDYDTPLNKMIFKGPATGIICHLKDITDALRMSMRESATYCGVPYGFYVRLANNKATHPSLIQLEKICRRLNVGIDTLFTFHSS